MHLSVATANFYFLPFQQTLDIIAAAGFEYIELDLPWEWRQWAMAQHLQDVPIKDAVAMIRHSGLKVSTIHDTGGTIHNADSIEGFIDPLLPEYLQQLGYPPGCIVFHTPHIESTYGQPWWEGVYDEIVQAAQRYQNDATLVTIENMPPLDGYYVPLLAPQALLEFVSKNKFAITLDTTHYAQMGMDVVQAAQILKDKVKTIHLSDYSNRTSHVFIGDGTLDFPRLFPVLDLATIYAITLECSMGYVGKNAAEQTPAEMLDRLKLAKSRLESWINAAES